MSIKNSLASITCALSSASNRFTSKKRLANCSSRNSVTSPSWSSDRSVSSCWLSIKESVMEGRPLLSGVVADTQLNKGSLFRPINHGGRTA